MSIANRTGALGLLLFDAVEAALQGLSPSAAAFLLTAFYRPGASTTEIAAIAGVSQPTGVRVLAGLRTRGLIEAPVRRGRATPILLTEFGRARAQVVQTARLEAMQRLLGPLDGEERAQFAVLIDKIMAGATVSRAFARTTCRLCDHPARIEPECPLGTRASLLEQSGIQTE